LILLANAEGPTSPNNANDNVPSTSRNKGGHPKGTTDAKKRAKQNDKARAVNWIFDEYAKMLDDGVDTPFVIAGRPLQSLPLKRC
jgi:hypothetical protein